MELKKNHLPPQQLYDASIPNISHKPQFFKPFLQAVLMTSVSPDFEINMLNQKEMQSNDIYQFSSPIGQNPKNTPAGPCAPVQETLHLPSSRAPSCQPGMDYSLASLATLHREPGQTHTHKQDIIYMKIKQKNQKVILISECICACTSTRVAHHTDGAFATVTDYLGDIVDTLLESVHDHFFQDGHGLFIG